MRQESVYAGIDVAKDRLDVALRPSGAVRTVAYEEAGIRGLVSELQALGPAAVVLESTGGLELPLAGGPGGGVPAGGGGESPSGARLCQGYRRGSAGWPRPMRWTPRCWPISPRPSVFRSALCRAPAPRNSIS